MPVICKFMGIVIMMLYNEHNPPHFHARYGDFEASFDIETLGMTRGKMPPKARALIVEWAAQKQNELYENWDLARAHKKPHRIDPLN